MVSYANMLYPQYEGSFDKTITPETWKWLQAEASKNLIEHTNARGPLVRQRPKETTDA
jgi:hypothetical protein